MGSPIEALHAPPALLRCLKSIEAPECVVAGVAASTTRDMPSYVPKDLTSSPQPPFFHSDHSRPWIPIYSHPCEFALSHFDEVMLNLIRNPNLTASHLFRADILFDSADGAVIQDGEDNSKTLECRQMSIDAYDQHRTIIRRFVPRNTKLDKALNQTCLLYTRTLTNSADVIPKPQHKHMPPENHLVIYLPHADLPSDIPYYHPSVRALAFLYEAPTTTPSNAIISVHCIPFSPSTSEAQLPPRLLRTAYHLLATVHKHASGLHLGYTKRSHHDVIIPQPILQTTYTRLKHSHARRLLSQWAETTDPTKHVFEDLGIAAFLLEVWATMYAAPNALARSPQSHHLPSFPGFADIGCGNGILVDILVREGYPGIGIDVRARKSWATFDASTSTRLREQIIVPAPLFTPELRTQMNDESPPRIHDGLFGRGTFLVSNHADELTAWTPLLAALQHGAFLAIPCCSHSLAGARMRAPPVPNAAHDTVEDDDGKETASGGKRRDGKQKSAYAALVAYTEWLARDVGFPRVEREELRIGSTRNIGILGSWKSDEVKNLQIEELPNSPNGGEPEHVVDRVARILRREGGGQGWVENAMKLQKSQKSSH